SYRTKLQFGRTKPKNSIFSMRLVGANLRIPAREEYGCAQPMSSACLYESANGGGSRCCWLMTVAWLLGAAGTVPASRMHKIVMWQAIGFPPYPTAKLSGESSDNRVRHDPPLRRCSAASQSRRWRNTRVRTALAVRQRKCLFRGRKRHG